MQEYDACIIEVGVNISDQTLIHVNWSNQLTPHEIEHHYCPHQDDQRDIELAKHSSSC